MKLPSYSKYPTRSIGQLASLVVLVTVSGCSMAPFNKTPVSSEYEACVAQAWSVDRQAHHVNGEPQFLLSARIFAECDGHISTPGSQHSDKARMVPVAMASLNYARGGDIKAAAKQLAYFESHFSGKDLYFADGSSFVDTMRLVTASHEIKISQIRLINVNDDVRAEFLRLSKTNGGSI